MALFSTKNDQEKQLRRSSLVIVSPMELLFTKLFWIIPFIAVMLACDYLFFPMSAHNFDVSRPIRSLLADADSMAPRMSLRKAIWNDGYTLLQKGTKWRFESIKKEQSGDGWPFGPDPIRKEYFEGKIFEVYDKRPTGSQGHKKVWLRRVSNKDHEMTIVYNTCTSNGDIEIGFYAMVKSDDNTSTTKSIDKMDLNYDETVVVQVFGDAQDVKITKSIEHDYKDLDDNLEFMKEIGDVSIKASNGMYLEWKDEANNQQITATAQNNDSPNSQWRMSFEKEKVSGNTIVRILNEAKALADDGAFIRFDENEHAKRIFDVKGFGWKWCRLKMKQADGNGNVTLKAVSERQSFLCLNESSCNVVGTAHDEAHEAWFEIYVGDRRLEALDFQRTNAHESDIIDMKDQTEIVPSIPTPASDEKNEMRGKHWIFYVLIAAAILVFIACVCFILFVIWKRRKRSKKGSRIEFIRSTESTVSTNNRESLLIMKNGNEQKQQIKITKDASFKVKPLNEWKSNKMTEKSDDDLFEEFEGDNDTEAKTDH